MHTMTITRRQALATAAALAGSPALAQTAYPNRPVKFIVPFPAGGPVDVTARAMAQKLGELWGQTGIVDNRAGAGGIVLRRICCIQSGSVSMSARRSSTMSAP